MYDTNSGSKRLRPEDSGSVCPLVCPSCAEDMSDAAVECQWYGSREHYKCAGMSQDEYEILALNSRCVMFFCSVCQPRVGIALEFFNKMCSRQDLFDKRLQSIEQKLNNLTQGPSNTQESDEMSTNESSGKLPKADILPRVETIYAGSISTAVTSALTEEKDREKRKLNLIMHNLVKPTADEGQTRKKEDVDKVSQIFQKILELLSR